MKVVAICSGGLDSTVMFHYLRKQGEEVEAVNFFYGSKHNARERESARGIFPDLREIDIDLSFLNSALTSERREIPHGGYQDENMKQTVVPFRNGIMLAYAVAMAEDWKFNAVAYAAHGGDHAIYPDCRPGFVAAFDEAAMAGTYQVVRLLAPFRDIDKGGIVAFGRSLGIELLMGQTWSCYEGGEIHCGLCGACNERKGAFVAAGVKDLTAYRA